MFKPRKTSIRKAMVCFAVSLSAGTAVRAQQSDGSPVARSAAPLVNASLEDRIATARSVKVLTSILEIEIGSQLDDAHERLDKLCAPGTRPKEEGEVDEADKAQASSEKKQVGEDHEPKERKAKPGEEHEEGHKVLWQLDGTDYSAVYITADDKERIDSITGILRPEKRMPFDAIGEVSKAPAKDDNTVVWDVLRVDHSLFRVVAKGTNGKADSIRIFSIRRKSGELNLYKGAQPSESH